MHVKANIEGRVIYARGRPSAPPCPFRPALVPLEQLNPARLDAPAILKRLASSGRALAELKIDRGMYYINRASDALLQPQPA